MIEEVEMCFFVSHGWRQKGNKKHWHTVLGKENEACSLDLLLEERLRD